MTDQETISRAAEEYYVDTKYNDVNIRQIFIQAVSWRDSHPSPEVEELVRALDFYAKHHHHLNTTAPNFAREAIDKFRARQTEAP